MRFFDDKKRSIETKKIFGNIEKRLNNLDSEIAYEYLSWLDKKTLYFKQSLDKKGYNSQPDNLQRGDIVWVEFGINVGTELSDYKTKGHYALVWAIDLGNVIVIPLSSRDAEGSSLTFDLGIIEGLNDKDNNRSYLKLDAIRSISKRRIARMLGKEEGKIHLSEDKIAKVKEAITMGFIR